MSDIFINILYGFIIGLCVISFCVFGLALFFLICWLVVKIIED